MLPSAVAIAGIIGLAAILLRILRHHLNSSDSHTHKPQSQDKNQNEDGCTEQEVTMFDSDGIDVQYCCIWDDLCTFFKVFYEFHINEVKCIWDDLCTVLKVFYEFHRNAVKCMFESNFYERRPLNVRYGNACGCTYNSNPFDASERGWRVLENVMESLADPNTHLIGVYGFYDEIKDTLLQRVSRRVQRDQLFGIVVTATVTKSHDVKKVQDDIACQLGFTFTNKSKDKRAKELIDRIKNEQNILIVLRDLYMELDLSKVGIPYNADHMGCKILLTSAAEHVLADHMHTQKNFMV